MEPGSLLACPLPVLRVLQHFLPIRTALLFFGETLILTLLVGLGMSRHLWDSLRGIRGENFRELRLALGQLGLGELDAFWICILSAFLVALLCQVAIGFSQLYEFQVSNSRTERSSRLVEAAGAGIALCLVCVSLTHAWDLQRALNFPGLTYTQKIGGLVGSLVASFLLLFIWRAFYHWLMRRVNLNLRVLILGSRDPAHELARLILDHPEAGFEIFGMVPESTADEENASGSSARQTGTPFSPLGAEAAPGSMADARTEALVLDTLPLTARKREGESSPLESLDQDGSLLALARDNQVDLLVVALEDRRLALPIQDLLHCRLGGRDVREREEIYEQVTGKIAVEAMRPSSLIFNEGFRRHPWIDLGKRVTDVSLSLFILAVTSPLILLTALAVALDSPGPILFRQERVGQDGTLFTLRKFRSMRMDAESATGPVWSSEDDPRITRVGKFIRMTRLDELPQLFNVLRGSMSLVGPRPERQHFVDELSKQIPYYNLRHIVKPGLTGWAQINYPYGSTVQDALHKLQYDLFYIKNHSVMLDLSVLFSTIKTVLLRQGT